MPVKSTTKRSRGRPAHVPTAASKRKVAIAAGGGALHEQIAVSLEISTDTLRKYYEHELSVGASQRRVNVLEALYKAVISKGSTSAAKLYLANEPQFIVPPLTAPPAAATVPAAAATVAPAPAPKLGKKDQAAADAVTAAEGTAWNDILPKPGMPLQ
jgi:hypothetical protein